MLVGLQEIADMLGVKPQTVRAWRTRGVLPDPDYIVSGSPIWQSETILAWAATRKSLAGRLPE